MRVLREHFRPEFLNRVDDIVVFHPLGTEQIRAIVEIQLGYLKRRLLERDIPSQRLRIAPGTTLHRGNCTVAVRTDDILVTRGRDRLRVPPDAQLYATPEGLTLVYQHGDRTEIRVY